MRGESELQPEVSSALHTVTSSFTHSPSHPVTDPLSCVQAADRCCFTSISGADRSQKHVLNPAARSETRTCVDVSVFRVLNCDVHMRRLCEQKRARCKKRNSFQFL
ncbi:hypothetical protein ABVT39_025531 [Epinephelus coioides]